MTAKLLLLTALLAALGAQSCAGQDLRRRAPLSTEAMRRAYETPEYEAAYQQAEESYRLARVETHWTPVPWDSHKQLVWLEATQQELLRFAKEVDGLGANLDHALQTPSIQEDAARLAPIRQIEDRFTRDCLTDLNEVVAQLDLVTLFRGNGMAAEAAAWVAAPVPKERNTGKVDQVSDFANHLAGLFAATMRTHTIFARSTGFDNDPLRDEKGKILSKKDYLIYWRTDTSAVVQRVMVKVHEDLARAEEAADRQGIRSAPVVR